MGIDRCRIICFSPTGSTRMLAELVAAGTGLPYALGDCTLPEGRAALQGPEPGELVILAAPVYYGRVQATAAGCIASLDGRGLSAVVLVNYGNRQYDDALLELATLAREAAFVPVAAGAFVSEHSLSTAGYPMAVGRPDADDRALAMNLGRKVMEKLAAGRLELGQLPGNMAFKPYPDLHRAPLTTEECTLCGQCAAVCPAGAIRQEEGGLVTDEAACIVCQACVKLCPANARVDAGPGAQETRTRLAPLVAGRREAEFFL